MRALGLWVLAFAGWNASGQLVLNSPLTERFMTVPGEFYEARVVLTNPTDAELVFDASVSDYHNSCDSGYVYATAGTTAGSLATWLELEQERGVIAPKGSLSFKVRAAVPEGFLGHAAHGCVFIESGQPVTSGAGLEVGVKMRYAVNFIYRNPIVSTRAMLFAERLEEGDGELALTFKNKGTAERLYTSKAKVVSSAGEIVYECTTDVSSIQPQQCRTQRFTRLDVPEDDYLVVVLTETDEGERFGLTKSMRLGR
ncbi:MAG: hypothetical protein RL754_1440 [Bacteroidota bacterium]|jgi:hypothetical protein